MVKFVPASDGKGHQPMHPDRFKSNFHKTIFISRIKIHQLIIWFANYYLILSWGIMTYMFLLSGWNIIFFLILQQNKLDTTQHNKLYTIQHNKLDIAQHKKPDIE